MTRVAIIGNSHVGAYVQARGAIEAAFPSVRLSFFALPRHSFSSCVYTKDGILRAREPQNNGLPDEINLAKQDHILMVGQRFAIERLARLIRNFDVLGLPRQGHGRTISHPLLRDFLDIQIERFCGQLDSFLGSDPRCVLAPPPFIAENAPAISGSLSDCTRHPAAATLMSMWINMIKHHMSGLKYGVTLQPDDLQTGAFETPEYLTRAHSLPQDSDRAAADYTHMNKEYGLAHFKAYATRWLGLCSQPDTDTLIKEH